MLALIEALHGETEAMLQRVLALAGHPPDETGSERPIAPVNTPALSKAARATRHKRS